MQQAASETGTLIHTISDMISGVNEVTRAIAEAVDVQKQATTHNGRRHHDCAQGEPWRQRPGSLVWRKPSRSRAGEAEAFKSVSTQLEDVIANMEGSVHAFLDAVEQDLGARRTEMKAEIEAA